MNIKITVLRTMALNCFAGLLSLFLKVAKLSAGVPLLGRRWWEVKHSQTIKKIKEEK